MDCSPPGSSVRGIFQARVLEWGARAVDEKSMISILALQNLENSCKTTPPLPPLLTLTRESGEVGSIQSGAGLGFMWGQRIQLLWRVRRNPVCGPVLDFGHAANTK